MNGPFHYAEAERRLTMAWEEDSTPERSARLVAEAQVHATLALAAATAAQLADRYVGDGPHVNAWLAAIADVDALGVGAAEADGQDLRCDRVIHWGRCTQPQGHEGAHLYPYPPAEAGERP